MHERSRRGHLALLPVLLLAITGLVTEGHAQEAGRESAESRALALHHAAILVDGHNDLPWRIRGTWGLDFDSVPKAQDPLTGAGARRTAALDRGGEQLRQERIFFGKPVRFVSEATPLDGAGNAAHHTLQNPL